MRRTKKLILLKFKYKEFLSIYLYTFPIIKERGVNMNYLVIPAYEPDYNLIKLIEKIHYKSDFYIIVIDDGSSAECQDIFARAANFATVLRHQVNQGKGQALKTAFEYIQSLNKPGTVVTADADGQHRIWDIFRSLTKSNENPNTLVLGVRAFTGKVPLRSRFGNSLTRILFKLQTGVAVSDTQTGLRAFSTDMIPFMFKVEGQRYEYEMNMLLEASQVYPILEVPIETVYINDNEASHFRPIRDGLMIYKNILKFALSSFSSFIVDYVVYALSILCLSFIPYVGPMIACVVGAIFIFTVSPTQALLSLLLYQVIQLIEGNLIYPKVVGQSIGLPAIFTLAAASIGGNLFGLLGMIFFTPIFAVIYRLVKEFVVAKENQLDKK